MTEKEKAKAYDEAIERAKKWHNASNIDKIDSRIIEEIFPELKESDDEKIKNAILNHLKKMWGNCQDNVCGVHVEDAIDWLEKQGEQASSQTNERAWLYLVSDVLTWKDGIRQYLDDPRVQELAKRLCSEYTQKLYNPSNTGKNEQKSTDKIEPRFKVGDWVVNKFGDSWHIDSLDKKNYQVSDGKGNYNYLPISKQDEMHLWTIQDAKDGDVLEFEDHGRFVIGILSFVNKTTGKVDVSCLLECNKFKVGVFYNLDTVKPHPATKEQRDSLMKAMNDAGYE